MMYYRIEKMTYIICTLYAENNLIVHMRLRSTAVC